MTPVRVATVGYLNARPLTDYLPERLNRVSGVPSTVARLLAERQVDLALVPVAALLADPTLRVVPGVCIGAAGPVASVLLVAETPPEAWERVVLDGESRTSALLARLLLEVGPLAGRVPSGLRIEDGAPGVARQVAQGTTAALIIGDAARELPDRLTVRLDLAALWHEWTGQPFVFAVWAGRADLPWEVVEAVRQAGATGLARRAIDHQGADLEYLTQNLRYELDDRALVGLRRFAALCKARGLVVSADPQLYGPARRQLPRPSVEAWLDRGARGEALPLEGLRALAEGARTADLGLAARRLAPGAAVRWRVVLRQAAGRADGLERARRALEAGARAVQLIGEPSSEEVAGLSALGLGVLARPRSPLRAWRERGLTGLAAAGWGTFLLEGDPDGPAEPARWEEARAMGLEAEATVAVGWGDGFEVALWQIERLREAGATRVRPVATWLPGAPAGSAAHTAEDHLRLCALTRLALPAAAVLGSVPTEGLGMAQASLDFGADQLGDVHLEGDPRLWPSVLARVEHYLADAGWSSAREGAAPIEAGPRRGPSRRSLDARP